VARQGNNPGSKQRCTYKAGLRVPGRLLSDFTALAREREVHAFLEKHPRGGFKEFKKHKNLLNARPASVETYRRLFAVITALPARDRGKRCRENARALAAARMNDPALAGDFEKRDLPVFGDPADPQPGEISLHDYQYIAGESWKRVCAHLNTLVLEHVGQMPVEKEEFIRQAVGAARSRGKTITEADLKRFPEKAVAEITGDFSNIAALAFEQMAAMMEVYRDSRAKCNDARNILFPGDGGAGADFSGALPVLIYSYSVPRHLRNYLAAVWDVEPGWVRNTLVGWRRKVDGFLPEKVRVEPLAGLFASLAEHAREQASGGEQVKVIGFLQKKHVLHLLPLEVDLSPLLPEALHGSYRGLRKRVREWPGALQEALDARVTCIDPGVLAAAVSSLRGSVEGVMERLDGNSRGYKNCRTFLRKVSLLEGHAGKMRVIYGNFLPGNRYTRSAAVLTALQEDVRATGVKRLYTALQGVAALAFARIHPEATAEFESVYTPDNCTTRPYTSKNRKKRHLPANMIFNKYVALRKAHPGATCINKNGKEKEKFLDNPGATELFRRGDPVWLGLSIYSPGQFREGKLTGQKKATFWFQLFATEKMRECIERGAVVESIRLNVPRGPTRKIVADVILSSADPAAFARRAGFIGAFDREHGGAEFPEGEYLGSDFNRIGGFTVALSTEERELDLRAAGLMRLQEEFARKRKIYRKQLLPALQRNLEAGEGRDGKERRRNAEQTLLHRRAANLKRQSELDLQMIYLYTAYRTGARHCSWDGVAGLEPRGKKGALADAITGMPKRKGLYREFTGWAADLAAGGDLPMYKSTRVMKPFSSAACSECFRRTGKLKRTRAAGIPYDDFRCSACGHESDRHANSASTSAQLLKRAMEGKKKGEAS